MTRSSSRVAVAPNNPYTKPIHVYSRWHPINVMWRVAWMGGSLYALHKMNAYHTIMHSPDVSHTWFKVGLGAGIALFSLKAYIEMYAGKILKREISYKALPQETHVAILLICLSGIAFHIALWSVYGGNSMFVMFLVGAFLLNFCMMFPTIVQNIAALGALTFFLQEYQ